MSGRSSADPDKLAEYSSAGLLRAEDLRLKGETLRGAIEIYNLSAGEHRSIDTAMADRVLAIAERWRYLDEFAGDVGRGFAELVARHQGPLHEGVLPDVVTFDDAAIMAHGEVGYASEEEAIEAAEQLAEDMQDAIDSGDVTTTQMEEMIAEAQRGQHDPAFAVTFATDMGVDGMVAIPALLDQAQPRGGHGNQPTDLGWVNENLAPFGALLTTAMATRYDAQDNLLTDNQRNVDGVLSHAFVDEFVAYDGSDDERLAYSQLVEGSALPADDLVRIGNHQLDEMLTGEETTPQALDANINILQALAANDQASLDWMASQGIQEGNTNAELLLEYQPSVHLVSRRWEAPESLGDAIAHVVDSGLSYPGDANRSDEVFLDVVETVAAEGQVHFDQLKPVLGEGARTHMDQLALATTRPDTPGDRYPDEAEAVDYLEAIMDDDAAARSVYRGATEFIGDSVATSIENGELIDAEAIGGVSGLVTVADNNLAVDASAARLAAREDFARGVTIATSVVGFVPIGGDMADAIGALRNLGTLTANQAAQLGIDIPDHLLAEDLEQIADLRNELMHGMDNAVIRQAYATGEMDERAIRDDATAIVRDAGYFRPGMDTDFFVGEPPQDPDAESHRPMKTYNPNLTQEQWDALPSDQQATTMRPDDEAVAYREWLYSPETRGDVRLERTAASGNMTRVFADHRR